MQNGGRVIAWYDDVGRLVEDAHTLMPRLPTLEAFVESQATVTGYCIACDGLTNFIVSSGVMMGAHPSLREGMLCEGCGMSSRSRLLLDALLQSLGSRSHVEGAIFEALSPLAAAVARLYPLIETSEFLGEGVAPGERRILHNHLVRHESMLGTSYDSDSLDVTVHNDVLEHICDTHQALRENVRVLRSGGCSVFLMPFFPLIDETQVRGRLRTDGSIEHIEEPEYHGNGVTNEGIYTFYHFGPDFMEAVRSAGFARVEAGIAHDVFLGYLSNNYRYGNDGVVLPIVFRAYKA